MPDALLFIHYNAIPRQLHDKGVVMISMGSLEENQQLVEEQGLSFPILMWEDAVAREYQVPGTPFFYVMDREGLIVNKGFVGSLRELEDLIEAGSE